MKSSQTCSALLYAILNMDLRSNHALSGSTEQPDSLTDPLTDGPLARRAAFWSVVREIVETILLAVAIWAVINLAVARYVVDGESMEPNLHSGQFLMVNRLIYVLASPQRGDIIVFDYPGNPGDDYVKRVIGLPGDTVIIEDGIVYINGVQLEEPYASSNTAIPTRGKWIVPADNYFVLGDNRPHSSDSRNWGMLEQQYIVGKAWLSYWPPKHWGVLPHYDYDAVP